MSFPAILIVAAKKILKKKAINQVASLILNADPDTAGILISYTGALKSGIKWVRKYNKVAKSAAESVVKNQKIIAELKSGRKMGNKKRGADAKWSIKKAEKNIYRAMSAKSRFIKKSIKEVVKKKLKNMIPARRLGMSVKNFVEAVHDKKGWIKIGKTLGTMMSHLGGGRNLQHLFGIVDKYTSIDLTVNHFWKRISQNHNAAHPVIGPSGAASLRYIRRWKEEYQQQIFDRTFYFLVTSPQTGNFMQNYHSFNPVIDEYEVPVRGWGGSKIKDYHFYGAVTLDNIITWISNSKLDYGVTVWNILRGPASYYFSMFYSAGIEWDTYSNLSYKDKKRTYGYKGFLDKMFK